MEIHIRLTPSEVKHAKQLHKQLHKRTGSKLSWNDFVRAAMLTGLFEWDAGGMGGCYTDDALKAVRKEPM